MANVTEQRNPLPHSTPVSPQLQERGFLSERNVKTRQYVLWVSTIHNPSEYEAVYSDNNLNDTQDVRQKVMSNPNNRHSFIVDTVNQEVIHEEQ